MRHKYNKIFMGLYMRNILDKAGRAHNRHNSGEEIFCEDFLDFMNSINTSIPDLYLTENQLKEELYMDNDELAPEGYNQDKYKSIFSKFL
jgi:hypothetical protein